MDSSAARTRLGAVVAVLAALWLGSALAQDEPPTRPADLGLQEKVEVRLILIDFLVLDGRDRTVSDLTIDDFALQVDGQPTEIASLDVNCPIGSVAEPKSATERHPASPIASERLRRMVLVFDYDHMPNVAETYDRVYDMLEQWVADGYEHMVVTLGEVIRIESPFTRDLDQLHWTLRRMRNDRDLYARNQLGLTEFRFFDRMKALLDILERWDGRKAVVLFSGGFAPDGFLKDPQFEELTAMSAAARAALYPVDTGGLRAGTPDVSTLHRLATQTGGRFTGATNDVTLAYARAQRDIGCTYTIAFKDPGRRAGSSRRVTIRLRAGPRGARVVHPDYYVRRSREAKLESVRKTATMAPHIFENGRLSANYAVLEAMKENSWRTVVGVELRPSTSTWLPAPQRWRLQGLLRRLNGTVVRRFEREIDVPATDPATGITPAVRLFHELVAPAGEYALSVVATAPDEDDPIAATRLVTLAETPYQGTFVLGPILGRSDASAEGPRFEPLFEQKAVRGEPLQALSVFCVGGVEDRNVTTMTRWISTAEGTDVHRYEGVPVRLTSGGYVRCGQVIDPVSTRELSPGRYRMHALAQSAGVSTETRETEFVVGDESPK